MSISDNSAESRQLGEFVKMDLSRKKKIIPLGSQIPSSHALIMNDEFIFLFL